MNLDKKSLEPFVKKGIITNEQMESMLAESSLHTKTNFGDIISKIILIGSVLFGFGIITWIASNWDLIPDMLKITGTLFVILACYIGATKLKTNYDLPKVSEGVFLIGGLATGGLFALISQIYNIDSDSYSGILSIWFLAILLPTYLFNSRMLSILTAVLFSASTATFIIEHVGNNYEFKYIALVLLTQILVFMIGGLHYKFKEHFEIGHLYRLVSLTVGTLALLVMTFSGDWYYDYGNKAVELFQPILFYPILGIIFLTIVNYFGEFTKKIHFHQTNILLIVISIVAYLQMVLTGDNAYWAYFALNVLFIFSLIFTLYVSVIEKNKSIMNFGIIVSCLYIFSKAISWLEMLNGYVFFMAIGLIFILVGYTFERIRKNLISQINQ